MLLKVFQVKKDLVCQHGSLDNSENALRLIPLLLLKKSFKIYEIRFKHSYGTDNGYYNQAPLKEIKLMHLETLEIKKVSA